MSATDFNTNTSGLKPDKIDLGPVPHCFSFMQSRDLDYIKRQRLTIFFPVL